MASVGKATIYIDADQYERRHAPRVVLDVTPGAAESFSLEGLAGVHFVTSSDGAAP